MIEVIVCRTGTSRYDAALRSRIDAAGGALATVECFDRCEVCERFLLARMDGALVRFRDADELIEAVSVLQVEL